MCLRRRDELNEVGEGHLRTRLHLVQVVRDGVASRRCRTQKRRLVLRRRFGNGLASFGQVVVRFGVVFRVRDIAV